MKRSLFVVLLFGAFPAFSLVAPEIYQVDTSCPKNAPFTSMTGGKRCVSCNTTKALMLENPKDCDVCPNRTINQVGELGGWIETNYCRLKKCPADKPFYEEKWNWSGCKSCEDEPTLIKKEECEKCSNMRWVVGSDFCAPNSSDRVYHGNEWKVIKDGEKSVMMLDGGMVPFSTKCAKLTPHYGIGVSAEECSHCPNAYMKDGFCFGKECPADKPIADGERGCVSCADEPRWITQKECERCPNMRWVESSHCRPNKDGVIYHADYGWVIKDGKEEQLKRNFTRCTELTKNYGVYADEKECARCPNTYRKDGFCFGKK